MDKLEAKVNTLRQLKQKVVVQKEQAAETKFDLKLSEKSFAVDTQESERWSNKENNLQFAVKMCLGLEEQIQPKREIKQDVQTIDEEK